MKSVRFIPATAERIAGARRPAAPTAAVNALAALHRQLQTKRHAALVLAHNGFASTPTAVAALMDCVRAQTWRRRYRLSYRIAVRLGQAAATALSTTARAPVRLPAGTPAQRLRQLRLRTVELAARSCLRHGAAGGTSFEVTLTRDPAQVGYSVEMTSNRTTYRGRYEGWAAAEDNHTICVPEDWRTRVQRRGLAVVGGMFTLDLQALAPAGEVQLYRAVWVAQSRGYCVKVHRGVMAVLGDEVYHADDVPSALRGIRLKAAQGNCVPPSMAAQYERSLDAFVARYRRHGELLVTADDARDIGACEYGIRSWCESVGIDMREGEVTLTRMLAAYRANPLVEARRTILNVIAQHRMAPRRVAAASRVEPGTPVSGIAQVAL